MALEGLQDSVGLQGLQVSVFVRKADLGGGVRTERAWGVWGGMNEGFAEIRGCSVSFPGNEEITCGAQSQEGVCLCLPS